MTRWLRALALAGFLVELIRELDQVGAGVEVVHVVKVFGRNYRVSVQRADNRSVTT